MLNSRVTTHIIDSCVICGASGEALYTGLKDILFGVSGSWGVKKCSNKDCGLLWADPMPNKEELSCLYVNYYTHADTSLPRIFKGVINGHLARKYGYKFGGSITYKLLSYLLYLEPGLRAIAEAKVYGINSKEMGSILEVGCGSGKNLQTLSDAGWDAQGIDFDEKAVSSAAKKNLNVKCGDLFEMRYPSDSFDVVASRHLIEHVPDPFSFFDECNRILKPGGRLIICTPDSGSHGHKKYGRCWRGLEPPRHLYIYNKKSLGKALLVAGFEDVRGESTYAGGAILYASHNIKNRRSKNRIQKYLYTIWFHYQEWFQVKFKGGGEEMMVSARKCI